MLWGDFDDRPLEYVYKRLMDESDAELVIVDQNKINEVNFDYKVGREISGSIQVANHCYSLSEISAVYLRPYAVSSQEQECTSESYKKELQNHRLLLEQVFISWLEMTPALVINKYSAMASNCSKPFQAQLIKNNGFKTPQTIVTTSSDKVSQFINIHGNVIYKSISSVRSIVSRLSPEKMKNISDINWVPTQFQEQVNGSDFRVHVIGSKTISSKINCSADDYRYAHNAGKNMDICACQIPKHVQHKCVQLVKNLGLVIGGVDLRLTPDGEWYCFEVNPSPGFSYYQSYTGQDIAGEVVNLLLKGQEEKTYTETVTTKVFN